MNTCEYIYSFSSRVRAELVLELLLRMAETPTRECFQIERIPLENRKPGRAQFVLNLDTAAWDKVFLQRFRRRYPNNPASDQYVLLAPSHFPRWNAHDLHRSVQGMVKALDVAMGVFSYRPTGSTLQSCMLACVTSEPLVKK